MRRSCSGLGPYRAWVCGILAMLCPCQQQAWPLHRLRAQLEMEGVSLSGKSWPRAAFWIKSSCYERYPFLGAPEAVCEGAYGLLHCRRILMIWFAIIRILILPSSLLKFKSTYPSFLSLFISINLPVTIV